MDKKSRVELADKLANDLGETLARRVTDEKDFNAVLALVVEILSEQVDK